MKHLSPEEFVDAIEGTLAASRAAHFEACEACRLEAGALGSLVEEAARASEVDEPSPLFWPHFAARVRAATLAEQVPEAAWWQPRWRLAFAAASVVAIAATVFSLARIPAVSLPEPSAEMAAMPDLPDPIPTPDEFPDLLAGEAASPTGRETARIADPAAWQRVMDLSGSLPAADALTVVPSAGASGLIEELSQAQLREFMRLLRAEMGGM